MRLGHKEPCKSDGFYIQRHVSQLGPHVLRLMLRFAYIPVALSMVGSTSMHLCAGNIYVCVCDGLSMLQECHADSGCIV